MASKSPADDYDINKHDHSSTAADPIEPVYKSGVMRYHKGLMAFIDWPVTWFRENIVTPNQKKYPWYHEEFRRVPTIDQCYTDDVACIYEADSQYKRDRNVDSAIINILRYRMDDCVREEFPDYEKCFPLKEAYEAASAAWFTKYGDLGALDTVLKAYMKQKHRLLWERRHGKVGTGMRNVDNDISAEVEDH